MESRILAPGLEPPEIGDFGDLTASESIQPRRLRICRGRVSEEVVMSLQNVEPPTPNGRGRPFARGNPGRRRGSKNRTTLVAEALLKDEEHELLRKGIELAKAGNVPMLKLFLEPMLPKERSVRVDLPPMESASDAVDRLGAIVDAAVTGQIAPSEAAALANLVAAYARITDVAEFGERLDNIEKELRALKKT